MSVDVTPKRAGGTPTCSRCRPGCRASPRRPAARRACARHHSRIAGLVRPLLWLTAPRAGRTGLRIPCERLRDPGDVRRAVDNPTSMNSRSWQSVAPIPTTIAANSRATESFSFQRTDDGGHHAKISEVIRRRRSARIGCGIRAHFRPCSDRYGRDSLAGCGPAIGARPERGVRLPLASMGTHLLLEPRPICRVRVCRTAVARVGMAASVASLASLVTMPKCQGESPPNEAPADAPGFSFGWRGEWGGNRSASPAGQSGGFLTSSRLSGTLRPAAIRFRGGALPGPLAVRNA